MARLGLQNVEELAEFAADCDFEKTGQLQIALTPKHIEDCRANMEVAQSLGLTGYSMLSQEEVHKELNSPLYLGAAFVPGGGIIIRSSSSTKSNVNSCKPECDLRTHTHNASGKWSGARRACKNFCHYPSFSAPTLTRTTSFRNYCSASYRSTTYILVSQPLTSAQQEKNRLAQSTSVRRWSNVLQLLSNDG